MATTKKPVCIQITEQTHKNLKKLAKRENRSVSNLIEVWTAQKMQIEHKD